MLNENKLSYGQEDAQSNSREKDEIKIGDEEKSNEADGVKDVDEDIESVPRSNVISPCEMCDNKEESGPISPLSDNFSAENQLKAAEPARADNLGGLSNAARLFGVSDDRLEEEFVSFKATKIINRLNYMVTDNSLTREELRREILVAIEEGFESVTVPAARVKEACDFSGGKIRIRGAVSYPGGCDTFKAKAVSVKELAKLKASAIEVTVAPFEITQKKRKTLLKEWKKLKKLAAKAELILTLDVFAINLSDLPNVAEACRQVGVNKLKLGNPKKGEEVRNLATEGIATALSSVDFEGVIYGADSESIFNMIKWGAKTVSTTKAVGAAMKIKKALGIKEE